MPAVLEILASEHWGERKAAVGLLRQSGELAEARRDCAPADPHVAVRHAAVGQRWHPPSYSSGQYLDRPAWDVHA